MHDPGVEFSGAQHRGGGATSTCPVCKDEMPSKRLPGHIADEHGDGGDDGGE